MARAKRNPSEDSASEITRNDFMALLNEAIRQAKGVAKVAVLVGTNERSVHRWLAGEGPSHPRMVKVYPILKNMNWSAVNAELLSVQQRSQAQ